MKRIVPLLIATLLPGTAQAVGFGFAVGHELVVNDPFVTRHAPGARFMVAPWPWLEASIHGAFAPHFGEGDWTAQTRGLVEELHIAPDLSRIRQRGDLTISFLPAMGELGPFETRVGPYAGVGAVRTQDDLELLQVQGNPEFEATWEEWHAATIFGLSAELRLDSFGLGVRIERQHYTEVVGTTTLETKKTAWAAMEASWRFGGSSD